MHFKGCMLRVPNTLLSLNEKEFPEAGWPDFIWRSEVSL